jgi:mono/diheme cytochrome c family protein
MDNVKGISISHRLKLLLVLGAIALTTSVCARADDSAQQKPFDVKSTFRNICGFCHEDYGRHAGKGPQLMNSTRSDEYMHNRIKKGKPGRMAAFGSIFSDEQIDQIVAFIRNLKPDQEPQNP